jgi:hypothetical protein
MDATTTKIVNELFETLVAINPAFKQAWPSEREFKATKLQWMIAFEEADIRSFEELRKGVKAIRARANPFIPSPGEFIAMCKLSPEDIGAPGVATAYLEACRKSHPSFGPDKDWSHPAVGYARNRVGSHKLCNLPESHTISDFKLHYFDALKQFMLGRNINQIERHKQETVSVSEITGM